MAASAVRKVVQDRRFLFGVTFAAAVLGFVGPLIAYDLWWHLKAGGLILADGAVPATDPFSFTAAGRPWVYHSWLSGVILTTVWRAGGMTALTFLRAFLIAGSLMVAWAAARRRGVGAGLASVLVLAACVQLKLRALTRPFLFSFVFFTVFAVILRTSVRARSPGAREGRFAAEDSFLWGGGGRLILLPVLIVLWANLHAGFIGGLLLIGAFGAGEMVRLAAQKRGRSYAAMLLREADGARFRALFVVGVLCLAASVVTPYGPGSLLYPFRLMHNVKLVKRVMEWQPMPFGAGFVIFWAMALVGTLIMARSVVACANRGRLRDEIGELVTDLLLMGGFILLAVQAVRHMAWFLLLAPSVLGYHLAVSRRSAPLVRGSASDERKERHLYPYVACLLAFVCGLWPLLSDGLPEFGPSEVVVPIKACDYMAAEGLHYRGYNSYEWGGYLIWRFWPQRRVFIDGRCLVYGDEIIGQALDVEDAEEGWEGILDDWGVQMLLVRYRKKDSAHLFSEGRWRCVYWDDVAVIGLRDDVFEMRAPGLAQFPLTNPVLFDQTIESAPAGDILTELDAVLTRDPECWTALSFRARCLLRLAAERQEARAALLKSALRSAQRAVALQEEHYEPWRALAEVAAALGDEQLAARATRRAEKLKPRGEPDH